VRACVRAVNNH